MKKDRLLSIFLYLMNKKRVSASELASHFEVSVRTIQRDIDSLSMAGIPVYADRGKDGGYSIVDNYKIDKHFLHPDELSSLKSILTRLSNVFGNSALNDIKEKIVNLSDKNFNHNNEKHEKLIIDFNPWGMDEYIKGIFKKVFSCVENKRVILIEYASPSGLISSRNVEPLSVVMKGSSWYLYCFCRLKKDIRFFKLTRIVKIEELDSGFDPEVHPVYENDNKDEVTARKQTVFVLKFEKSAKGRITDYYNPDSLHFMPDGSIIGIFPFPEDEWVYSWILSFGPLVKVLEPLHARQRMESIVTLMAEKYNKS